MKEVRAEAKSALVIAAETMKRFYDRSRGVSRSYNIGDKVWLEGRNVVSLRPTKKLDDKRYGPFVILERVGKSAYKLDLPSTWRQIHPTFNEVLLTPFIEPTFSHQSKPPPPPAINVEGHPEYEVAEILQVRRRGRGLQYLVHWKGYTHEEDTWEPRKNLTNVEDVFVDFYRKNPSALRTLIK
jgi:hypothetical protein